MQQVMSSYVKRTIAHECRTMEGNRLHTSPGASSLVSFPNKRGQQDGTGYIDLHRLAGHTIRCGYSIIYYNTMYQLPDTS